MTLDIAGGGEIVNACMCIGGANGGRLGLGAGTCNARGAPIAVGCCAADHGSDRVTVADGVVQPLQDDRVYSLGFDVPISLDIKRVAFPRRRCSAPRRALVHVVLRAEVHIAPSDDGLSDLPSVQVPASHVDADQAARACGVDGETGRDA